MMSKPRQGIFAGTIGFVCGCIAAGLLNCTVSLTGGNSSETTNVAMISGTVVDTQGSPVADVLVTIRPADYDPVKDGSAPNTGMQTTGADGKYRFSVIRNRLHTIEAVHRIRRTRALVAGAAAREAENPMPQCTLNVPGAIKVMIPETVDTVNGYFYLPGTNIVVVLRGKIGSATLDSVPAATIPVVYYATKNAVAPMVLRYNVHALPGDTAVVAMPAWKYSRRVGFNTGSTGADVSGNVVDFPVLLRLTGDNFDFGQAKSDGADIRFTKSNGDSLPCEIERWDAGARGAEIWVRADTVYGGDSAQSMVMYWGNPDAASPSNGAAVFDTSRGFTAVWHLGESGDSVFDATRNGFNGRNDGTVPAAGMIGNARNLASGKYIQIAGLLKTPANVTLSAWVQFTPSGGGQEIVSLGDHVLMRLDDSYGIGTSGWYHNSTVVDTSFSIAKSGRFLANTGWHYIAYSINTATHVQTLYIDGTQSAVSGDANPINYAGLGADTYIGIHGNGKTFFNFSGRIDEVRVNNVPLDADWIKLCFMNQTAQDALIEW